MDLEITWSKVSWLWIRAHSLTHWWIYVFVYRPGSWIM